MKGQRNKFCQLKNLQNESDVEQFFVAPLLADLGYGPDYLRTKATLKTVPIDKGRTRRAYVPDYLAYTARSRVKAVLVIDAKHPHHPAEDGVIDAQLYASVLRRSMGDPKPDQFCIGINGHSVIVKHYDSNSAIHSLSFSDCVDGNQKYAALKAGISRPALTASTRSQRSTNTFQFSSVAPGDLPAIFEVCHRSIWKSEKRSPASAFYEFAKIMFVKIDEDRRLRAQLASNQIDPTNGIPPDPVRFSVHWIDRMTSTADSPIDTILFARLTGELEEQIARGDKKRIFSEGEGIRLNPTTIRDVVDFLQHFDLYSVDEDLNGRLFETFLTATVRGKALGQFFTPRSVVKFMVRLARLRAGLKSMDFVLDGCCGTGGFLIEAMADMSNTIAGNKGLSPDEKDLLNQKLRTETLWGIDAGKDPEMARIARLNMLLHKDGGSRIYFADALDKQLRTEPGLPVPVRLELDELRSEICRDRRFSCILSNPPFSMTYSASKPKELAVLEDYVLATDENGRQRSSLRSAVMFMERYFDLLTDTTSEDGPGRLITVMDESVLNTLSSQAYREYILDNFILRAVISLPKNAFVKAQGKVKTSVMYLRRKISEDEPQPDVFMAICNNVGHSDSGKERPHLDELPRLLQAFDEFETTGAVSATAKNVFQVSNLRADNPTLRLDAHYFDPRYFATMTTLEQERSSRGWAVRSLEELLRSSATALTGGATPRGALYPDVGAKFIRVQNVKPLRLEWNSDDDACISAKIHSGTLRRSILSAGDVVLTITGTYGVAATVPDNFGDANINQHSVKLEVGEDISPEYLAVFLNSDLCRPQLDRAVTGSSRLALDYRAIKALQILYPTDLGDQRQLADASYKRLTTALDLSKQADAVLAELPGMLRGTA